MYVHAFYVALPGDESVFHRVGDLVALGHGKSSVDIDLEVDAEASSKGMYAHRAYPQDALDPRRALHIDLAQGRVDPVH